MKYIYTLISFFTLISFSSHGQSDLIGIWHLDSFTIEGNTYKNVYNDLPIEFTTDQELEIYLWYEGVSSCNAIFGAYSYGPDELTLYGVGMTLVDCGAEPRGQFENLYVSVLSNNYSEESNFNYTIDGNGTQQTLTLTNVNGNQVNYSKIENNNFLTQTWYLQTIIENGLTYNVNPVNSPSLSLGINADYVFGGIEYNGQGICNSFNGNYNIYFENGDELSISSFVPTSNICDPPSDFEDAYFSILSNDETNQFSFEIINDGENLVLTSIPNVGGRSINLNETSLTFGKQALSIDEYDENQYDISLLQNPVENKLLLNIDNQLLSENLKYTIYGIDGKQVKSSILNNDSINVEDVVSGVYFISFVGEGFSTKTIKFIKK